MLHTVYYLLQLMESDHRLWYSANRYTFPCRTVGEDFSQFIKQCAALIRTLYRAANRQWVCPQRKNVATWHQDRQSGQLFSVAPNFKLGAIRLNAKRKIPISQAKIALPCNKLAQFKDKFRGSLFAAAVFLLSHFQNLRFFAFPSLSAPFSSRSGQSLFIYDAAVQPLRFCCKKT